MGRFHYGISLTLLILAGFLLGIELVRHRQANETLLLAGCFLVVLAMVRSTLAKIRETKLEYLPEYASLATSGSVACVDDQVK
jgi:hypothetical protein